MTGFSLMYAPQPGVAALAPGATLACLGDSITAANGGGLNKNALGFASWACLLSRQRAVHTPALNFGVSGENSAQILARVGQVIAARPAICVVLEGTNDTALSYEQTIANMSATYSALLNAGIIVVAIPITPRSTGTSAQRLKMNRVNDWIRRRRLGTRNLHVLDLTEILGDQAWSPLANYTYDGLHPQHLGAYYMGKALAGLITSIIPVAPAQAVNSLDVYDATDNPTGNLLPNGIISGTGGSVGTFSGQMATSFFTNSVNLYGSAVALSKSTMADGKAAQRIQWSGAYTGGTPAFQISSNATVGNISIGDTVELSCEIEVAAGAACNVSLTLYAGWSGGSASAKDLLPSANYAPPGEAWSGVLKTPPIPIANALTALSANVQFNGVGTSGTAAHDVKIGPMRMNKVF